MGLWVHENFRRVSLTHNPFRYLDNSFASASKLASLSLDDDQTPAQEAVSMLRLFRLVGSELLASMQSTWNQHWRLFDTPDETPVMIRKYLESKREQQEAQMMVQKRATPKCSQPNTT